MSNVLVVIGHGMVGHRFVRELRARDRDRSWRVVVLAEEPVPAYDRLHLSERARGAPEAQLSLPGADFASDDGVELRLATRAVRIDREAREVLCADGARVRYDALVLAAGSRPFVPPVPGHDLPGCHVYRTLADVAAIRAAARPGRTGVVVGGGLLGLEAAGALQALGMRPHVVEGAPWLMPLQLDEGGGAVLGRQVTELGVAPHCGVGLKSVDAGPDGTASSVTLADGTVLDTSLVVFSTGVRPRDELAADAGLNTGERGGFHVDGHCRTADERIWAVGECAAVDGRCFGLVTPGYRMAESVASTLTGETPAPLSDPDLSTELKLLGVAVASFGDAHARTAGAMEYIHTSGAGDRYAKLVLDATGNTLLGGVLAGDSSSYGRLRSLLGHRLPGAPEGLLGAAL
ncbi:NAD(P)/FAD-dependent oxidoreductase [Streptomyces luteolus]|uniref:FAD-dependent oxidoreductase n=1 Tax=Streptomyces luteolus TaxID=3043615 RepID=A0ABT6T8P1_9ACTN|nr:FAD-dependent oxidoreductase [Streptomyces sp. B-S-A12]MDI3424251.1 FAD-dependent oxidoreductase [Streptomyces sp. B-S-A12]